MCLCANVYITWGHLRAVLQYLRSEELPNLRQLAEETTYIGELADAGVKHW